MIELRMIRHFIAVAERLHFRKASEALHISQSAVSRSVTAIEEDLGVKLLERGPRSVSLTAAGHEYLSHSRSIIAALELARVSAQDIGTPPRPRISITYMDAAISGDLPLLIAAFSHGHADIIVDLEYAWSDRQVELVLSGEADIGFVHGPARSPLLSGQLVWRDHLVAVLPSHHPLASSGKVPIEMLEGDSFVIGVSEEWRPLREQIFRACGRAGFSPRLIDHEVHSRDAIFGLIAAGQGVTLYPSSAASTLRAGVVLRELSTETDFVDVFIIWRDKCLKPAAAQFIEFAAGYEFQALK